MSKQSEDEARHLAVGQWLGLQSRIVEMHWTTTYGWMAMASSGQWYSQRGPGETTFCPEGLRTSDSRITGRDMADWSRTPWPPDPDDDR